MKKKGLLVLLLLLSGHFMSAKDALDSEQDEVNRAFTTINRIGNNDLEVIAPKYIFSNTNTKFLLQFKDVKNIKLTDNNYMLRFIVNGEDVAITFDEKGTGILNYTFTNKANLNIYFEDFKYESVQTVISIWYVILPIGVLSGILGFQLMKRRRAQKMLREEEHEENFIQRTHEGKAGKQTEEELVS